MTSCAWCSLYANSGFSQMLLLSWWRSSACLSMKSQAICFAFSMLDNWCIPNPMYFHFTHHWFPIPPWKYMLVNSPKIKKNKILKFEKKLLKLSKLKWDLIKSFLKHILKMTCICLWLKTAHDILLSNFQRVPLLFQFSWDSIKKKRIFCPFGRSIKCTWIISKSKENFNKTQAKLPMSQSYWYW